MYKINLVVGDKSGDGHDKRELIPIECSLDSKELEHAFKRGSKLICGNDNLDGLCSDYEDRSVPKDLINKLLSFGINIEDYAYYNCKNEFEFDYCDADNFVSFYMKVAQIGDKKLEWQFLSAKQLYIGGYGLFF